MVSLVDSSVFIALYNENDSLHKKAVREVALKRKRVSVHPYVIEEVCSVLLYKQSKAHSNNFLRAIKEMANVEICFSDTEKEMKFFLSHNHKISFTDSTLLMLSQKKGVKLVTFDKTLARLAKL